MEKENIAISVVCITYNHVKYIRRVLEGIVNQKLNVPFEVIVHDDASTDGTSEIIREYANKYPDLITAIIQEENQTSKGINVRKEFVHPFVKGKYYAWTEGDDYWICDSKLQNQFDFMESYDDCMMCYHNAINYDETEKVQKMLVNDLNSGFLSDKLIFCHENGNYPTTSIFARAEYVLGMPDEFYKAPIGDHVLRMYLATKGKIYYLNEIWAVRNYAHSESWTYAMNKSIEKYRNYCIRYSFFLEYYNKYTNSRYLKYIKHMCNKNIIGRYSKELNLSCEEWIKVATEYFNELPQNSIVFSKNELIEDGLQTCSDYRTYIVNVLADQIRKEGRVFIYGAGVEATKKAVILFTNNIEFEGFLVSDLEDNPSSYMGKTVYKFQNVSFTEDDLIWGGIDRKNKIDIIPKIKERKIRYITL